MSSSISNSEKQNRDALLVVPSVSLNKAPNYSKSLLLQEDKRKLKQQQQQEKPSTKRSSSADSKIQSKCFYEPPKQEDKLPITAIVDLTNKRKSYAKYAMPPQYGVKYPLQSEEPPQCTKASALRQQHQAEQFARINSAFDERRMKEKERFTQQVHQYYYHTSNVADQRQQQQNVSFQQQQQPYERSKSASNALDHHHNRHVTFKRSATDVAEVIDEERKLAQLKKLIQQQAAKSNFVRSSVTDQTPFPQNQSEIPQPMPPPSLSPQFKHYPILHDQKQQQQQYPSGFTRSSSAPIANITMTENMPQKQQATVPFNAFHGVHQHSKTNKNEEKPIFLIRPSSSSIPPHQTREFVHLVTSNSIYKDDSFLAHNDDERILRREKEYFAEQTSPRSLQHMLAVEKRRQQILMEKQRVLLSRQAQRIRLAQELHKLRTANEVLEQQLDNGDEIVDDEGANDNNADDEYSLVISNPDQQPFTSTEPTFSVLRDQHEKLRVEQEKWKNETAMYVSPEAGARGGSASRRKPQPRVVVILEQKFQEEFHGDGAPEFSFPFQPQLPLSFEANPKIDAEFWKTMSPRDDGGVELKEKNKIEKDNTLRKKSEASLCDEKTHELKVRLVGDNANNNNNNNNSTRQIHSVFSSPPPPENVSAAGGIVFSPGSDQGSATKRKSNTLQQAPFPYYKRRIAENTNKSVTSPIITPEHAQGGIVFSANNISNINNLENVEKKLSDLFVLPQKLNNVTSKHHHQDPVAPSPVVVSISPLRRRQLQLEKQEWITRRQIEQDESIQAYPLSEALKMKLIGPKIVLASAASNNQNSHPSSIVGTITQRDYSSFNFSALVPPLLLYDLVLSISERASWFEQNSTTSSSSAVALVPKPTHYKSSTTYHSQLWKELSSKENTNIAAAQQRFAQKQRQEVFAKKDFRSGSDDSDAVGTDNRKGQNQQQQQQRQQKMSSFAPYFFLPPKSVLGPLLGSECCQVISEKFCTISEKDQHRIIANNSNNNNNNVANVSKYEQQNGNSTEDDTTTPAVKIIQSSFGRPIQNKKNSNHNNAINSVSEQDPLSIFSGRAHLQMQAAEKNAADDILWQLSQIILNKACKSIVTSQVVTASYDK